MKNPAVFFTVYDGDTEKNFLRSGILKKVVDAGFHVVLLVRAKPGSTKEQYYKDNFQSESVTVEPIPPAMTTAERYWFHLSWNTLPTHTSYVKRHDLLLRHKNWARYAIEMLAWYLGHSRVWRHILRKVYYLTPDSYCSALFETYRPVLLFAANMFSAEDFRLLRAAKKQSIPTLTIMKSWDVPTTRGFTRVQADRILTFNEINRAETIAIGDYAPSRVHTVGFPQFDLYTHKEIYESREGFCKRIGADPTKNILLFAAPGDWKQPFTAEILELLDNAVSAGKFEKPVQILARFHPKYPSRAEHLKHLRHVIKDRPGTYFARDLENAIDAPTETTYQWTFTDSDLAHLANSLKHSAVVINTESTITLDATAVGKPVILIGFDGRQNLDYWHSIVRNYKREHLSAVLETGGAPLAKSMDELIEHINRYLHDEHADIEGRARIKQNLLFGNDGKAAERIAGHIIEMARSSTVE